MGAVVIKFDQEGVVVKVLLDVAQAWACGVGREGVHATLHGEAFGDGAHASFAGCEFGERGVGVDGGCCGGVFGQWFVCELVVPLVFFSQAVEFVEEGAVGWVIGRPLEVFAVGEVAEEGVRFDAFKGCEGAFGLPVA